MLISKDIYNVQFLRWWSFSCALLVVFTSCSPSRESNAIYVNTNKVAKTLLVDDFFSEIDTIELGVGEKVQLGKVVKIIAPDNYFVMLHRYDDYSQNYIAIFNDSGKLVSSLEPSDDNFYSFNPLDIAVTSNGRFEVLEGENNEIWEYDGEGNVLTRKKLPFSTANFTYMASENLYVFYKNEHLLPDEDASSYFDVIFTDATFKIVDKYYPFQPQVGPFTKINLPYPLGKSPQGNVFFAKSLTDSLLAFDKTQRKPEIDLSFDFPFSIKDIGKKSGDLAEADLQEILNAQGGLLGGYYAFSEKLLSFNLVNVDGPIWGMLDLSSGQATIGHHGVSKNGGFFPPFVSYLPSRGFVTVLNESNLSYTPDHYLDEGLAERVINTNDAFLLIASAN